MGHGRGQIPHGSLREEPETPSSRYLLHVEVGTFKGTSSLSSPPPSFLVFDEYRKISGREIEDSIKREMSGSLEDVFLAVGASPLLRRSIANILS